MTNKVWFITGASKGIGLLLTQQLLARGYRVAATSRTVDELAKRVTAASDRFLPIAMDITDERSVGDAVRATLSQFGALDVVVNNAGYGQFGTVEEITDAEARRNFDVNVFGALNVLRAALPHLREQRSGHVFNISSIGGLTGGFSGFGVYCATKFALSGLTEALRVDLEPFGVKTTLVYPGYFRTEFLSDGSLSLPSQPIAAYSAARASEVQHRQHINGAQLGDPSKAADALIAVYERDDAPLHLMLGSDAVARAEAKLERVRADIDAWRAVSVATDFSPGR